MKSKKYLFVSFLLFWSAGLLAAPHEDLRASMEWVKIENPNADFETTGDGRVEYVYWIGKKELSIAQIQAAYTAEPAICDGDEDWWNSDPNSHGTNAPATMLSWHEAARFCNWLTSGSVSNGAYQLDESGLVTNINRSAALEQFGIIVAVPTDKEWYRAAYWTGSDFSDYANGTDTAPQAEVDALYNAIGTPWTVGSGAVEQNGTFDMGGNIDEWTETPGREPYTNRYFLHGGYYAGTAELINSERPPRTVPPESESTSRGVRVAAISGQASNIIVHGEASLEMEFISMENAGDESDVTGSGGVDYIYQIGKYEVTVEQFMTAYSADSSISDGDEDYWNNVVPQPLGTNAPASRVTWHEAAKFCNWLTSGSSSNGAYQLSPEGVVTNIDRGAASILYSPVYVIPTEDEWYKAAYWTVDGYSDYPNGSNNVPPLAHAEANYCPTETPWSVDMGEVEQNGTLNMMGNIGEFTQETSNFRIQWRGGYFRENKQRMDRSSLVYISMMSEMPYFGLRPVVLVKDLDSDADGLDDDWEILYFGNATNATETADSDGDGQSNRDEYIAGFDPTNRTSRFEVSGNAFGRDQIIGWNAVSGRVYSVYWTTNLLSGFQCLESNIPWTRASFTNESELPVGYYRLEVQSQDSSSSSGGGQDGGGSVGPSDPFEPPPGDGGDGDVEITAV